MLLDAIPAGARVFDCRHKTGKPDWGRSEFERGHVPGARHIHLDEELSAPRRLDGIGGRHPLPDPEDFAACLRGHGVSTGQWVVAYDDIGGAYAARLWWMLRWLGHERVGVFRAPWATGDLEPGVAHAVAPGNFRPDVQPDRLVSRTEVSGGLLIDARAAARYLGEHEPFDAIAGHIPGAINRPWTDALQDGALTHTPTLPPGPGVVYCGSGVTACVVLLMAEAAGRHDLRLYPGSWSDWIAAGGAVATGAIP